MISYRDKLSRITFILLLASVLMIIVTGCSAGGIKVSFDTDGGSPHQRYFHRQFHGISAQTQRSRQRRVLFR